MGPPSDAASHILAHWHADAHTLGSTARALFFGLHPVAERPAANYRQLSRYDATGLVRKNNTPALGPVGDGPDDMGAAT
jgi:hypothetical protein